MKVLSLAECSVLEDGNDIIEFSPEPVEVHNDTGAGILFSCDLSGNTPFMTVLRLLCVIRPGQLMSGLKCCVYYYAEQSSFPCNLIIFLCNRFQNCLYKVAKQPDRNST